MAEHHGRVVPSFNLRNFFYGFLSGPVPTLEALRTSTKSGSGDSPSSEADANRGYAGPTPPARSYCLLAAPGLLPCSSGLWLVSSTWDFLH